MASASHVLAATLVLWLGATGLSMTAQQTTSGEQAAPQTTAAPAPTPESGIPIAEPLVQRACGACHRADDKQQLSRISFQRNTPEGWQNAIRRMIALNGLQIAPEAAREVVKYLSNHLGLAPEEARAAAFEAERRLIDFKYEASADAEAVCTKCHSMGRVISQRRTREEWDLLIAMHRGWYPLVDNQAFRRSGPPPREPSADGQPPDPRHPVEKAVEHLAGAFPFTTPEWAAWSATMRPARLEGTWALSGTEGGKGPFYGRVLVTSDPDTTDEFTTEIALTYAGTGERVSRRGRAVVYTGFQWRGRSAAGEDEDTALREVMFVDRDWRRMEGRWFAGGYDEIGMDVRLERVAGDIVVLGTNRQALRTGTAGGELTVHGLNLPASLQAADVDLGPGITVTRVAGVTSDAATITVDVARDAPVGARDLFLRGASRARVLAVFDRVDGIKVTPAWAMARVGGVRFPKMIAQFEARAFHHGADGRPDTADDIDLGIVPARWSLEEYAATYDDDDVLFVGTIDAATGRFTPNADGPNPARRGQRNNIGDVYAVATYTTEEVDGESARTHRARAHLLVTVPLYIRWEPTFGEVGR